MRPAMTVAFFVILLLLVATAQGIRLDGEFSGAFQKKLQEDGNTRGRGSPERGTAALGSEDARGSGRSRKLLTDAEPVTESTRSGVEAQDSQKLRPKEEAAGAPVKPEVSEHKKSAPVKPEVSEHKKSAPDTYPDLMDIAGMDYSPAVRKPPIHN